VKFGYIAEQHRRYPVQSMCRVMEVSKSGYYAWRQRGESVHAQEDRELLGQIERIHEDSGRRYGSPRVWQALRQAGRYHSRKRVARLMTQRGLFARKKRRLVHTTQANPTQVPSANLLARDFHAEEPNRKWVSDIKQIPTEEGAVYLAVHLDLYSRKVVGWAMEDTMEAALTIQSMRMALQQRQPEPDLLTHSDRGSQYSAEVYRAVLSQCGCQQSMSQKGDVWDNAPMESFFSTLEFECLRGRHFQTRAEAKTEVFTYIETFYNRIRLHSTLDYLSPEEFEAQGEAKLTVH
jgi:putative transposase